MNELRQQVLPSGAWTAQEIPKLPRILKPVTLLSENTEDALVPVSDQNLMTRHKDSGSLANSPAPVTVLPTQFQSGISKEAPVKPSIKGDITADTNVEEYDEDGVESWDGQVLTEKELEELMEMEKPSRVVQVGKEFFDAEGNFLYRIWRFVVELQANHKETCPTNYPKYCLYSKIVIIYISHLNLLFIDWLFVPLLYK